ncbi:MAG: PorV/PorQ family protein [Ignavibacteria bacterium]|nr:PorV/PorQ family protein [Ignavibacteria bacterium]
MKSFIIYLTVFLIQSVLFSQNNGSANTGMSFLKLGVSSRSIAMGEAVVSNVNDASATHYNPAALFSGSDVNLIFMHSQTSFGVRSEYLAFKLRTKGRFAFGLSLNNTAVNDIEIREIPGEPIGTFNAQNFAFGISASYKFNEMLSLGATGKFLFEKIYVDNASGFAADIGVIYRKDIFSLGLSFSNFGTMSELRNKSTKLPSSVRLGGSYLFKLKGIGADLLISSDGYKVLDGGKFHVHIGSEFVYKNFLSLRAGYQSGYENRNITAGIGVKYNIFTLDYSFIPYRYSTGLGHTITLGANF